MEVYYIIAIVPWLACLIAKTISPGNEIHYRRIFILLIYAILLFFAGFRSPEVGGDLTRYLPEFNRMPNESFGDILLNAWDFRQREFGFALLEKTISALSFDDSGYIFIIAQLILTIYLAAIYKYSEHLFVGVLLFVLYLYTCSFNILRASIAMALCLYSFQYIVKRDFKKYLLLIFLAFTIQKTSLFFFPAYYLYGRKLHIKSILIVLAVTLLISLKLSGSELANLAERYFSMFYMSDDYLNNTSSGLSNVSYLQIVLILLGLFIYKYCRVEDKVYVFFIYMMVVAAIIQFFSPIFTLLTRISGFYFNFVILYIPYLFKYLGKYDRWAFLSFSVAIFYALYFITLDKDVHAIVPYKFNF